MADGDAARRANSMRRRTKARLILTCLACALSCGGWRRLDILSPLQHAGQVPSGVTPEASEKQPQQQLSLEERADIFMARKAYADAVDYYTRALRQSNQKDPELWNKLGIAYQQQMDFNASRKAYKEAIRHRQDYPEAWNNLGTTFYLTNKFTKSIKYYRKAIELRPGSASFRLNL